METGTVYLVGAGPGDVGLMTIRGRECLEKADVVLYDRLVNPLILSSAKAGAETIYCGKLPDRHHLRQEAIQELMVQKAKENKTVVRLKGGDPGMFGRSGEEAAALVEHGITYEVIPGITSGIAAPLYAGVPVTHRDYSGSFAAVTAHSKSTTGEPEVDWGAFAKIDTISFYMGVKNLPHIVEKLIENGKPETTSVLIVEWGTTARQKTVSGTLATIVEEAEKYNVHNPAITLVGNVSSLYEKLNWFEKKYLHGRYAWIVKTAPGAGRFASELREYGAEVLEYPRYTIEWENTEFPEIPETVEQILFHSPDSVRIFFQALKQTGKDIRSINCSLGSESRRTNEQLKNYGIIPAFPEGLQPQQIFHAGPKEKLKSLPDKAAGKWLTHTIERSASAEEVAGHIFEEEYINTVILPSAQSAAVLAEELKRAGVESGSWLKQREVICFGPATERALRENGWYSDKTLDEPDIAHLIQALHYI